MSPTLAHPKESCCTGSLGSTHTKHRTNPLPSYYHLRPRYKPVPAMSYKPVPVPAMSYKPVPAMNPKPAAAPDAATASEDTAADRDRPPCLTHPLPSPFSCLFPATATQQNKSCSEILASRGLAASSVRSFARRHSALVISPPSLPSPAWFLRPQPKVPPAPASRSPPSPPISSQAT